VETDRGTLLVDEKNPARGRLRVLMKGLGTAVAAADFGDPVAGSTSYAVCVYDEVRARVGGMTLERAGDTCAQAARPCWKPLGSSGFRYADRDATAHGIRRLLLKGGPAGAGKLLVKAKVTPGRSLTELPPGMPLALVGSGRATVQVVASDGACFSLTVDQVTGSDAGRFSARRR
jgi:hypothetical protein